MVDATANNVEDEVDPVADEPDNDHPQQLPLSLGPSRTGRSTQKAARLPPQAMKAKRPARHHVKRE
jgi:hypothetical protein